jgi:prolyl oligopeptidase
LITLFGKLPRLPYGVKPVPKYSEKSQTTAYYEPGSLIAGRPGYFVANTYALNTRPKWEMEALALHESVPGHHLQLSLALELEEGPEFRKHQGYTAFVEGWGLYSESLGKDLGMYKDPYSEYGRLTYEIWRAIRLVVDTGLHSKGWSRQQAIDYFTANAGKSEHDITVEVDRYIVWPAQALAYKIGELKFKELKEFAKKELGDKFDIREFHDQLLCNGALPMDVLDERVRDWVASRKTQ